MFKVRDYVYLKVLPMKGVTRFGVKGKLAPHYIGPFQIIEKCEKVAYRLKLPEQLSVMHNVFHVLQLKKCLQVPDQVTRYNQIVQDTMGSAFERRSHLGIGGLPDGELF
jgi:hypothetical protein